MSQTHAEKEVGHHRELKGQIFFEMSAETTV